MGMEKPITTLEYDIVASKVKKLFFEQLTRDFNGEIIELINSLIDKAKLYYQGLGKNVVGDANANGTSICTLSTTVAVGSVFICTKLKFGTNVGAIAYVGTGTIGSMTDYYILDCQASGEIIEFAGEEGPLFVVNNIGGASALTVRMYAPREGLEAAAGSNNDTSHRYNGYIGGLIIS